jgi:hypothetical protein
LFNFIKIIHHRYFYTLKKFIFIKNFTSKYLKFNWEKTNLSRLKIINHHLAKSRSKKYLEIGCDKNLIFNNVRANLKIGVDPTSGGNRRCTSDFFFKNNTIFFDVIFIDGLHEYTQVRKDFLNSLKFLKNDGCIIIHDLIPRTWLEEHVPRLSSTWCGDIWKISYEIKKAKHLTFELLLVDFGVGIVKKINNNYYLPKIDFDKKKFNFFYKNYKKLPLKKYFNQYK